MCGIAGFSWNDVSLATRMSDVIAHRGPDQNGTYLDDFVSLGNRRLSVIDLRENGRMPMANQDASIWITYNGEIYNFQELRDELRSKGHTFQSRTDTEVIVHAYEEYGMKCLDKFNGMFAFAIWDRGRSELYLARDRIGIKPLYYYFNRNKLVFASEIKSILQDPDIEREIDPQSLYQYIGYEFVPAPNTIFRHIQKLPQGHYLRFKDGNIELNRYWDVRFEYEPQKEDYYVDQLRERLKESVRKQLVSDVPLGAFLSGGLDSSAVVAFMSQLGVEEINTFSLGYEDPTFSELPYAKTVADRFKTNHRTLMIDPPTPDLIEKAVWFLDEPMTELSAIPFYLICEKARETVTVCLSGEGGDELLAGYDRFKASKLNSRYGVVPGFIRRGLITPLVNSLPDQPQKKGAINMIKRFIEGSALPPEGEHMRWQYFGMPGREHELFSPDMLSQIDLDPFEPIRRIVAGCNSNDRLDREIYVDLKTTMVDSLLVKADRMSMAHGLEVRVPFLDHEFVEFCATIPGEMKLKGFNTKKVFRSAMKGILPDSIINRGKQGYSLPIKNWLRNEMRDYMQETLASSPLIKDAFNSSFVDGLITEHLSHKANHSHILWALTNLAVWHRQFVEAPQVTEAATGPVNGTVHAGNRNGIHSVRN